MREERRVRDQRFFAYLALGIILVLAFLVYHRGNLPQPWTRVPYEDGVKDSFPGFPVDINTAGVDELVLLPGVGRRTAETIIEERERRGGFGKIEDLKFVRGIGDETFNGLRSYVRAGKTTPEHGRIKKGR